jgi:predicted TIM-barrel fold metal-dependent hydrolase
MYKIFSVDDHIIEPADVWSSRVPARYRECAPHVIEEDGREYWVYEGQRNMTMGLNAVAGKPREQWGMEPRRFADMIPGCYDPKARAQDLLAQGVLASVNFPTLPRFGGMLFSHFKDKDLANVCVQAWNDFILDDWCPGGPEGLFVPMIICQVWDPHLAASEIQRCADKGARSLCFTENPVTDGLPSFHDADHWAPIWRVCEEAQLAVSMHIGSSGFMPVIDPAAPFTGAITSGETGAMLSMVNILLSPVLHRFPKLKLVFSEGGVGWVPAILHRADRQTERHSGWAGKVDMKPSELFARNMWVCMVEEPLGLKLAYPHIGADKIVSELDYPHADTTFPRTQRSFEEVFEGIPADVVDKVSHLNAEQVFRWKMADEALLSSPDVSSWSATLEADPYAAMSLRHDISGIDHVGPTSDVDDDDTCHEMVTVGNMMVPCGQTFGPDGACPGGHARA